jgi:L-ascorbate metabolism protein UlaG (beta-lactamase superfamily)
MTTPLIKKRSWTRRAWVKITGAAALLGLGGACAHRSLMSAGPGYRGAVSDHFDGERFFNPRCTDKREKGDLMKWMRTRKKKEWPATTEADFVTPDLRPCAPGEALRVTFIGHATFLIQTPQGNLLTDPFFSERSSPVSWAGPRRSRRPAIDLAALPKIDAVLISHNHYDHLDLPSLRALHERFEPLFIAGLGIGAFLQSHGLTRTQDLDWWEKNTPKPGLDVTFVPARHWSNRGSGGPNTTLWGGFWLNTGGKSLYFAGDTGYCPYFKEIREKLGSPDLALLPIGAYEPRWFMGQHHMNPDDAVQAHLDLAARRSVGMHFGTIQLTDEGIDDPKADLATALTTASVAAPAFVAPRFGESFVA